MKEGDRCFLRKSQSSMNLKNLLMSSESSQSYPTFVSITTAHMSGTNAEDQNGMDQDAIASHQSNITNHQDENTVTITAFHHDQANSNISTDSDSHHVQVPLNSLASPGEQDIDIYEVREGSNADDSSHVWIKEEVSARLNAILLS